MSRLLALWRYRGFILTSVKREFQSKYRHSMLGAAWMVLNPLAMILVYTVVFSKVMQARLPGAENGFAYSIYLCAGVATWGLFSEITGRSVTVFLDNGNILKKLAFPRITLPVGLVLSALLNFAIIFSLFILFLLASGTFPGVVIVAVAPLLLLQILFSISLGIILGVLNVFFRDVGQLFTIILQFWFWFTPIVYPVDILPPLARDWLWLNPMADLIGGYQRILVYGEWPVWSQLYWPAILSVVLMVMGYRLFSRHNGEMVDEL